MTIHLCEIVVRSTRETIKFYEITVPKVLGSEHTPEYLNTMNAREIAVAKFEEELKYTPSLKNKVNGRSWCVDSIVL